MLTHGSHQPSKSPTHQNTTQHIPTQSTSQSGTADQASKHQIPNTSHRQHGNQCLLHTRTERERGRGSLSRNRWECRSLSRTCFAVRLELCTISWADGIDDPDEAHESLVHAGLQDVVMQEVSISSCGTSRHYMRPPLKSNMRVPSGLHKICPAKTLKFPLKYITKKPQSKRIAMIHMQTLCNLSCNPSRRSMRSPLTSNKR